MRELKLHSNGRKDHLETLTEVYTQLKNALKRNPKLTEEEKQMKLKTLHEKFSADKKASQQKLY